MKSLVMENYLLEIQEDIFLNEAERLLQEISLSDLTRTIKLMPTIEKILKKLDKLNKIVYTICRC